MANIKITDALHAKLKEAADANYRTIGGQIEYLMSLEGTPAQNTPPSKITEVKTPKEVIDNAHKGVHSVAYQVEKNPSVASNRSVAQVLAEINALTEARDEGLEYCQDKETRDRIESEYKSKVQPLWDEYQALKG